MSRNYEGYSDVVERIRDVSEPRPRMQPNVSWIDLVLVSPWTNVGDPYPPLQVHMDEGGKSHMRGAVTGGTTATPTITWLPEGYRPEYNERFNVPFGTTRNGTIEVKTTGEVVFLGSYA